MRTISGMIITGSLALALAGCGSKQGSSTEANVPITTGPSGDPNPPAETKLVYELDQSKHVLAAGPMHGSVGGAEVSPNAVVEGDFLRFQVLKPGKEEAEREISIRLRTDVTHNLFSGRCVIGTGMAPAPYVPEIMLSVPGKPTVGFPNGYAMTLELGPRIGGKMKGKIYLALPDDQKSFIGGEFTANAPRLPIEPPGLEDVPFINGSVTLMGAPSGAVVMTGYAAAPNGTVSNVGIAALDIELGESPEGQKWTQRDDDKPRVTSLIAGDGKKAPSRFEHSKLTPGRYLAFAGLKEGPASWKWVDVGPKSTEKADLVIDATKVGGLEVTAPLGSLSKIQMAPADDPLRPLDATLFELIAMQLKLEKDIVARKALFKNLAPGRYEVRDKASGQIRMVEIVAGKTIELDFDAKPLPKKPDPAPDPKSKG